MSKITVMRTFEHYGDGYAVAAVPISDNPAEPAFVMIADAVDTPGGYIIHDYVAGKIVDKLSAYEELGMDPDEIRSMIDELELEIDELEEENGDAEELVRGLECDLRSMEHEIKQLRAKNDILKETVARYSVMKQTMELILGGEIKL